ncbi:MAG: IS607 family transposase [Candidatus Hodarchaeales archaeon]|jgi:excisionase family DNA binding protein
MKPKYITIGEVARRLGKTTTTIRRWEREGIIKALRTPTGHRMFPETEINRVLGITSKEAKSFEQKRVALYARVSTREQQQAGILTRQSERLLAYAEKNNYSIVLNIKDLGSGLNEKRRGLKRVLQAIQQEEIDTILIEYKDRLARFGYQYLEQYANSYGVMIDVIDEQPRKELEAELVEDMIAIVTSFAARIYGRRSQRYRDMKTCLEQTTEKPVSIQNSKETLKDND